MSKKNVRPSVSFDALINALSECVDAGLALTVTPKKNWVQVKGPNGHRVYIAKTAEVRQVDLAEFPDGIPGTTPAEKYNGAVTLHMDLTSGTEKAVETLKGIVELMQTLPASPKGKKAKAEISLGRFGA